MNSGIRVSEEAKDFIREGSALNQDVTIQPDESEAVEENLHKRDLIIDLVAVAQQLRYLPSQTEIEKHSEYSPDRFREEFGDLFQAYEEAGIVPESVTRSDYEAAIEDRKRSKNVSVGPGESDEEDPPEDASEPEASSDDGPASPSREDLIEELQWVNETIDRIPYTSDINDESAFSAHMYQEEFGSWDAALEAAEIDKERALLEDMQRVANEVGVDLRQKDLNEYGTYSHTMAARYFGSWSDAKNRFQEWQSEAATDDGDTEVSEFEEKVNQRLDDLLS